MRNRHNIYADDLRGYDDLLRFGDVFDTFEEFVLRLNDNLYFHQIELDDVMIQKVYNNLFNRYKNNFFRFSKLSTIYNEVGSRVEGMLQAYEVAMDFQENLMDYVGTKETTTNYKTNNKSEETDPDNNTRYRTNVETIFTDNGLEYMDRRTNSIDIVQLIQDFVQNFRKLMMNATDEVTIKQGIYTK